MALGEKDILVVGDYNMIPDILSAIATVKGMTELTSLIIKAKTDEATTEKAIQLQSAIISLQSNLMAIQAQNQDLLRTKDDLEKKLIEMKSWKSEAKKYELCEVASGVFVMATKQNSQPSSPMHWICANCYQKREKSILQYIGNPSDGAQYECPNCKNIITDHNKSYSPFG